MFHKD